MQRLFSPSLNARFTSGEHQRFRVRCLNVGLEELRLSLVICERFPFQLQGRNHRLMLVSHVAVCGS